MIRSMDCVLDPALRSYEAIVSFLGRHTQHTSLSVPVKQIYDGLVTPGPRTRRSPSMLSLTLSSTLSLGEGRALSDSVLSVPVAEQDQTTVSAIGGQRFAAPCSMVAASARGCAGREGCDVCVYMCVRARKMFCEVPRSYLSLLSTPYLIFL